MKQSRQQKQQPLSSNAIQRLLNDPDLSPLLKEMIAKAGVYTSAGYQQVLHQFLNSDAAKIKLNQWTEEDKKKQEQDVRTKASEEAARKPGLGMGLKRLTRSKSFISLFESSLDTNDHNGAPSFEATAPPFERRISNESIASISSSTSSVLNTSKRTSSTITSSLFMDSLSSLNLNFNFAEETNPKNEGSSRVNHSSRQRRGSLNCPLRASRNHAECASRIQVLEKMI